MGLFNRKQTETAEPVAAMPAPLIEQARQTLEVAEQAEREAQGAVAELAEEERRLQIEIRNAAAAFQAASDPEAIRAAAARDAELRQALEALAPRRAIASRVLEVASSKALEARHNYEALLARVQRTRERIRTQRQTVEARRRSVKEAERALRIQQEELARSEQVLAEEERSLLELTGEAA